MSDELTIREAIPDDAQNLLDFFNKIKNYPNIEISTDTISVDIERDSIARIFDSPRNNLLLAINDGNIIGYCRIESKAASGELGIVIDQDFWRLGVGSELIIDTLDWFYNYSSLDQIWLEVFKNNAAAIALYDKFNFEFVKDNEETQIMVLKKDD